MVYHGSWAALAKHIVLFLLWWTPFAVAVMIPSNGPYPANSTMRFSTASAPSTTNFSTASAPSSQPLPISSGTTSRIFNRTSSLSSSFASSASILSSAGSSTQTVSSTLIAPSIFSLSSISSGSVSESHTSTGTMSISGPPLSSIHSNSQSRSPSSLTSSTLVPSTSGGLSARTSSVPGVTVGIVTSNIIHDGTTIKEPIITGGGLSSPITLPPVTTTLASFQVTSAVSSVSSQISGLIPVISSWKANPTSLKTDTLNKIDDIKSDVKDLISDLGGETSPKPCIAREQVRRGLLDPFSDVVDALSCIDENLEDITDIVGANDVEGIEPILDNLVLQNEDLTDDSDNSSASQNTYSVQSIITSNTSRRNSATTSATTSAASSEARSSSCTATETALQVTVLCTPSTITVIGSTLPTTTTTTICSPSTTVTTSGCSVTGLTTTVYSSASPTITQIPCSPENCGSLCPLGEGPLSGASMSIIATTENCALISTVTVSALPTASYGEFSNIANASPTDTVTSPAKRALSRDPVVVDEAESLLKRALPEVNPPYANYVAGLDVAWVSQNGLTSGVWYDFPQNGRAAAGVNGIYGCTGVFIISEKGIYISHIWENPVFAKNSNFDPTDDDFFITNSFNALRDGTTTAQSITGLIGTDDKPGVLHPIYLPQVFVLTPYNQFSTTLMYEARARDLTNRLARLLRGSGGSGTLVGYTRTNPALSTAPHGIAGRAILEIDPYERFITDGSNSPNVLLQISKWRLWIEDRLVLTNEFWHPTYASPMGTFQRRANGNTNPCDGHDGSNPSGSSSSVNSNSGTPSTLLTTTSIKTSGITISTSTVNIASSLLSTQSASMTIVSTSIAQETSSSASTQPALTTEPSLSQSATPTRTSNPTTSSATPPQSTPSCGAGGASITDAQALNHELDTKGDAQQCCGGSANFAVVAAYSGSAIAYLTGTSDGQCVGCGRLANYIAGIITACGKDGVVGGSQAINETPGLVVSIDINDH